MSFLDAKGTPGIVERSFIAPPRSQIGPITTDQRNAILNNSFVADYYEQEIGSVSAYEILAARAEQQPEKVEMVRQQSPQTATRRGREPESFLGLSCKKHHACGWDSNRAPDHERDYAWNSWIHFRWIGTKKAIERSSTRSQIPRVVVREIPKEEHILSLGPESVAQQGRVQIETSLLHGRLRLV